jgi:hypothetical protein
MRSVLKGTGTLRLEPVGRQMPHYRRLGHPSNLPQTRRTRPEVVLSPRFCRSTALRGSAWTLAYIGTSA